MPIKFSSFERAPLNPQIAIKSHTQQREGVKREGSGAEVARKKKKNRGNLNVSGTSFWQIGKKFRPRAAQKIL